jgi:hypothetical protein
MARLPHTTTKQQILLALLIFGGAIAWDLSARKWEGPYVDASLPMVPAWRQADRVGRVADFYIADKTKVTIVQGGVATSRVRLPDGREAWLPTNWIH